MNNKGFGLLGMLLAVLIIGILMTAVLKQYAGQTRSALALPGLSGAQQAKPAGRAPNGRATTVGKNGPAGKRANQPAASKCNGRLVGNICVPTEVRSSSLDAFEKMEQ